jgi:hypothetical protein
MNDMKTLQQQKKKQLLLVCRRVYHMVQTKQDPSLILCDATSYNQNALPW